MLGSQNKDKISPVTVPETGEESMTSPPSLLRARDVPQFDSDISELHSLLGPRQMTSSNCDTTLDNTLTNMEDNVASDVKPFSGDTQDPNTVLFQMLNMSMEEKFWVTGPPSKVSRVRSSESGSTSPGLSSPHIQSPPSSPKHLTSSVGSSPRISSPASVTDGASSDTLTQGLTIVSEEATLGDTLSQGSTKVAPDLQNLQTALRALIKEVTQSSVQEPSTSVPINTTTKTLMKVNSLVRGGNAVYSTSALRGASNGIVNRRMNQATRRPTLYTTFPSRKGSVELKIISQPEEQHRARYLTEGSRGAVKDRTGSGFPSVKLLGFQEAAKLQVFIGTDQGKVQPHMFYQASRVCGKNSTPCKECKIDGTTVLEIDMLPAKDMTVSCDCVGILKERNVDVEKRLVRYGGTRNKKRSTKCRMVFRVCLSFSDGSTETVQIASAPILCTQPPGIPEICKKSLTECHVKGELELFVIGKNFLKDTKIFFKEPLGEGPDKETTYIWEKNVLPEKEYLQPTHLICRVPPYHNLDIKQPVMVHLIITSGGRASEPHPFTYTPLPTAVGTQERTSSGVAKQKLPSGVAAPAVEINQQFAQTGVVPTLIQIPLLTQQQPTQPTQQTIIPTVVIPTTGTALLTSPSTRPIQAIALSTSPFDGSKTVDSTKASNIQLVVVQQQQQQSTIDPLNVGDPSLSAISSQQCKQNNEHSNLKRKVSPNQESLLKSEALSPFETHEMQSGIQDTDASSLGIYLQESEGAIRQMLPPNVMLNNTSVEQILVQEPKVNLSPTTTSATFPSSTTPSFQNVDQVLQVSPEIKDCNFAQKSALSPCEQWTAQATLSQTNSPTHLNMASPGCISDVSPANDVMWPATVPSNSSPVGSLIVTTEANIQKLSSDIVSELTSEIEEQQSPNWSAQNNDISGWTNGESSSFPQQAKKQKTHSSWMSPGVQSMDFECSMITGSSPVKNSAVSNLLNSAPATSGVLDVDKEAVFGDAKKDTTITTFATKSSPSLLTTAVAVNTQVKTTGDKPPAGNIDHISAMSILPDAELIRMINPNAFDNDYGMMSPQSMFTSSFLPTR